MRRRDFLDLLGSGIAVWPIRAHSQQGVPLIGFLSSRSPDDSKPHLAGFRRGLEAFGYFEGRNIQIEYRWAMGQYDELPRLVGELIALNPLAIAAPGGSPSARAAKAATNSIPILFVMADPVREGVVGSFSQPGGNITGIDIMSGELTGKRLELRCQRLRRQTSGFSRQFQKPTKQHYGERYGTCGSIAWPQSAGTERDH